MAMRDDAPYPGGYGEPGRPRSPHGLRIGDAERDDAAADLGEHYAAGRLNLDELHERLDEVLAARTFGQLTRIMTDLPGLSPGRLHWRPAVGLTQDLAFETADRVHEPTGADRAGRFAALALLMLAMLLWLFTALLFAQHGVQQYAPSGGSTGSVTHTLQFDHSGLLTP